MALVATFYLAEGRSAETMDWTAAALDLYLSATGDVFVWGADPKTGRARKLKGTEIQNIRSWVSRLSPKDDFQVVFNGASNKSDASPYQFSALAIGYRPDRYASVTFAVPISWARQHGLSGFLQLVQGACEILRPSHGYAGLGLTLSPMESGQGEDMVSVVPFAKRFQGVELDFPHSHSRDITEQKKIKGVNWLTILASPWLEEVGGESTLADVLDDLAVIHPYSHGVIIRAGSNPRLGDVNRGEDMAPYQAVARALQPIRLMQMDSLAPWHGLDRERTAEWLARFDK